MHGMATDDPQNAHSGGGSCDGGISAAQDIDRLTRFKIG
jgi:hypothetical protein